MFARGYCISLLISYLPYFAHQKEYFLSLGNIPVMMVFMFGCILEKVLVIFVIPTAICLVDFDVVCCKEIICAIHKRRDCRWRPVTGL